ncbi:13192_t:CDS:2 [Cetraspora pellucida]|uniref:13192_t:CDS:1 n=1 Tax=Cetraspora pellucida TaxID=1433469 RepID=A0A9N9B952_9GLOM|nr:13192_t:CDS:2 [Cetraspora pellucida]
MRRKYNPVGRTEFMSELVSDKIYYYGGYKNESGRFNDFFYIDLTRQFSDSSPSYQFIKNLDARCGASTVSYMNIIYVFGGGIDVPDTNLILIQPLSADPVITYVQDTISTPSSRKWHTSVIDNMNKKMYVWGGVGAGMSYKNRSFIQVDGNMYIFDIAQSVWTSNPTSNKPNGRYLHTATLIPDGRIIMIGGALSSDVGQLDVYDTKTNQWTNITATKNGYIPSIIHHSANLLPDNQIISPTGNAPSIMSSGHKATLYIDVIIFAFGEYDPNNTRYLMSPAIRILNISNGQYRWIDSYIPHSIANQTQNPSTQTSQTSNSNIIIIIGIVIGGIIGLGILVLLGYIIYLLRKRNFPMESSHEVR